MKVIKVLGVLVLFAALVVVLQLADPAAESAAGRYRRLPVVNLLHLAEAEWAAGHPAPALLLLDYVTEHGLPGKDAATVLRQQIFAQLAAANSPASRVAATGWAGTLAGANSFDNLAGSSVADAALYGDVAELDRQGALDGGADDLVAALNGVRSMAAVFPPAAGALTLAKAAQRAGALNDSLVRQLNQLLGLMQADPKSPLAVEKFRDNLMPLFELAKHCRTWSEFQGIAQQADSPDQLKVLAKITAATPAGARRLSQVLAVARPEGAALASACLDHVMRQGPRRLEALGAALVKGPAGLKLALDNPGWQPPPPGRAGPAPSTLLSGLQNKYLAWREQYGAGVAALKYLAIAVLCGLLVLVLVPGRYLEKLVTRPGSPLPAPGPLHYLLSALAVGAVLSGLAYVLALTAPSASETAVALTGDATGDAATAVGARSDSAFLSGTVVLVSLAIHAVVWFFVRGKLRQVEDDETAPAALRLRRLENLDVFLDLPLFTGLALTVIAFILITLDAGMSRHFAYTSTVVGILSAVSLRIRYQYPLKERLIHQ